MCLSIGKLTSNVSIHWKALVQCFPLVGRWLVWKVGNGEQVRIGVDPWVGYKNKFRFPYWLIEMLQDRGICTLNQAVNQVNTNIWQQGWKKVDSLGLEDKMQLYGITM